MTFWRDVWRPQEDWSLAYTQLYIERMHDDDTPFIQCMVVGPGGSCDRFLKKC